MGLFDIFKVNQIKAENENLKRQPKKGSVTVPNHKGDIPKGTVNSILRQAGLK